MSAYTLSDLFNVGIDILRTEVSDKTKKIIAYIGSYQTKETSDDGVEWWQHVGFASRPPKASSDKDVAQAVVIRRGHADVAIASQDLRGLTLYGNLADGETCIYAPGADGNAQARVLLKADGSINLFTKEGNDSGGGGMGIFVNADGSISIASSKGNAVLLGSDGSVKVFNGSGGIQVKADGHVKIASGSKVEVSGASITMGGPSALPVAIGPNVVTALTGLQNQITAVAAALVSCMSIAGVVGAAHASAAAAATSAVGSGAAAVSAAAALIPSKRTSSD